MKKLLLTLTLSLTLGVLTVATTSCETLTAIGLNPFEEKVYVPGRVIKASRPYFDRGTDGAIGKGRGAAIADALTQRWAQDIVVRGKDGKVYSYTATLNNPDIAFHIGDHGTIEIGATSGTVWGFKLR